ncbi:prepilin-type N-terminal cleavage/methylation domain-containing protein [Desulfogranum marinum]|uniref:prepilin-type N-terminal cleavage/methylation domain-containing protein n=1 Tax=Desulfogranum marinum TaxID=453220 RepID=UPI0029C79BBB|nr:prepilin-type N-terminal cleavage/methylation domain-containing protein [Desulfogranum marinum]
MDYKNRRDEGFTLIEAVIAMFILTVGILTLQTMQVTAIKGNAHANRITAGSAWATDRMEQLYAAPYSDGSLTCVNDPMCDRTGDGTDQDPDRDGVDSVGADTNFGLDNDTAATADHMAVSPDGVYTIYWNIAEDVPMPNDKTIRVIVVSDQQGKSRRVVYDYIKTDII